MKTKLYEYGDTELINELSGRFDHFVITGKKDYSKTDKDASDIYYDWHGDQMICIEMCADMIVDIRMPDEEDEDE